MNTSNFPLFSEEVMNAQIVAEQWQSQSTQLLENDAEATRRVMLKAALNGSRQAAYALAEHYNNKGNVKRAFRWYRQAALRGNVEAMKLIAIAYAEGVGVAVDKVKAAYWALRVSSAMSDCDDVSAEDATVKQCREIA